jgi:hypothetical protein
MVYTWDRMIYTWVPPGTLMVLMIHPGGVGGILRCGSTAQLESLGPTLEISGQTSTQGAENGAATLAGLLLIVYR